MPQLAPIALFVYRRPHHTRRTLEAISRNDLASGSDLYIFCDGSKSPDEDLDVQGVRETVRTARGFRSIKIIEHDSNMGLASSIVHGVNTVLQEHDRIIVLEDDMVTARNFLRYCNDCLNFYRGDPRISAISGYGYPIGFPPWFRQDIYVARRGCPWGWATWKDSWEGIDWDLSQVPKFLDDPEARRRFALLGDDLEDRLLAKWRGEIDAWSIVRTFSQFLRDELTLYPRVSKIQNIGCDATGVNYVSSTEAWKVSLDMSGLAVGLVQDPPILPSIERKIGRLFRSGVRARIKKWYKRQKGSKHGLDIDSASDDARNGACAQTAADAASLASAQANGTAIE